MRIMRFRNAFAYGKLEGNAADGEYVVYHFSGGPESDKLDAKRFDKIEASCVDLHTEMMKLISAITRTSSSRE